MLEHLLSCMFHRSRHGYEEGVKSLLLNDIRSKNLSMNDVVIILQTKRYLENFNPLLTYESL